MHCLTRQYELKNLTEHRCPECGREFDPDDSRTFEAKARRQRVPLWVILSTAGSAMLFFSLALLTDRAMMHVLGAANILAVLAMFWQRWMEEPRNRWPLR